MDIEALVKKVQKIEDEASIKNMHRDYLFLISDLDIEKALSCFSQEIVVEISGLGRHVGIEAVSTFFQRCDPKKRFIIQARPFHRAGGRQRRWRSG